MWQCRMIFLCHPATDVLYSIHLMIPAASVDQCPIQSGTMVSLPISTSRKMVSEMHLFQHFQQKKKTKKKNVIFIKEFHAALLNNEIFIIKKHNQVQIGCSIIQFIFYYIEFCVVCSFMRLLKCILTNSFELLWNRKVNPIPFDFNIKFRTITEIQYFWSEHPNIQCVALR